MSAPRTILITGGGSGIGAAMARRFAGRGARVAILGRTRSKLEAVADAIGAAGGARPLAVTARQENEGEVAAAVETVRENLGSIDVLVNNAAIYAPGTACGSDIELWDRMMAVNLRGPLLLSRAVVPLQRERGGGTIVNIASTLGLRPVPGFAAYSVSKAALLALTRALAIEEAAKGIRVLAVCPGVVDTPIHGPAAGDPAFLEEMGKLHPLGRAGTPDDVAALVGFLISEEASWMTGSVITIDGGISLV